MITFVNILSVEKGSGCIVMLLLQPDCCMPSYTQFKLLLGVLIVSRQKWEMNTQYSNFLMKDSICWSIHSILSSYSKYISHTEGFYCPTWLPDSFKKKLYLVITLQTKNVSLEMYLFSPLHNTDKSISPFYKPQELLTQTDRLINKM